MTDEQIEGIRLELQGIREALQRIADASESSADTLDGVRAEVAAITEQTIAIETPGERRR